MAQGDVERFESIVLPHLDEAYTLARHLLANDHDAQDAVQEAVLRALRHFETYREGNARAWLLAIVRNCCHTWRRKHRASWTTVEYVDEDHGDALGRFQSPDATPIAESDRAAIARAVAELSPEFREVIVLREIQELSYKEIAHIVGVPVGTIMSRLARARRRLQHALGVGAREA